MAFLGIHYIETVEHVENFNYISLPENIASGATTSKREKDESTVMCEQDFIYLETWELNSTGRCRRHVHKN